MTLLFPMNGKGQRFRDAGYTTDKKSLPVGGTTLFWKAVCTYKAFWDNGTRENQPRGIKLHHETCGPLETILKWDSLDQFVNNETDLLIADSDSFFEDPQEIVHAILKFRKYAYPGGVTIRKTNDPACSYASLSYFNWTKNEKIIFASDFREKDSYTEWSTTGPYWFRSGKEFIHYGRAALKKGVTSISPVYNEFTNDLKATVAIPVKTFVHLGTPEAYESYCRRFNV